MANALKQLGQAALSTLATLYTVPALTTAVLKSFDICNTTQATIPVRVFLVPSGGTAAAANALLYDRLIGPADTLPWEGEQVLVAGATIQVYGAVAGCTITASGVEIS